jgi:MFS family permease
MTDAATAAGLARYRALLAVPHAPRLIGSALVARMPMGMVPLALLLLVRDSGGSYAAAGLVSGSYFVALAVGAPIAGRLVDRTGHGRILLRRAFLFPGLLAGICVLAAFDAPVGALAVCAAAAGALLPPVGASLRALWPHVLEGPELRSSAYALEAALQEVFFVVGPLLVALLATFVSPVAALAVAAAAGGVGTLAFASTAPVRAARPEEEPDVRGALGALESVGVRTIVAFSLCGGISFGAFEVAAPAFSEAHAGSAARGGLALALFAGGSLVGGLVSGSRSAPPARSLRFAAVAFAGALALPVLADSLVVLAALAFVAGIPIAPAFAASYRLVDAVARRGTAAEAFAWISTAVATGIAAGTSAGGALVDARGVDAAFLLACGAAAAGAAVVLLGRGLER